MRGAAEPPHQVSAQLTTGSLSSHLLCLLLTNYLTRVPALLTTDSLAYSDSAYLLLAHTSTHSLLPPHTHLFTPTYAHIRSPTHSPQPTHIPGVVLAPTYADILTPTYAHPRGRRRLHHLHRRG